MSLQSPSTSIRLLVTRPQPQASDWAARLVEKGVDAHALPLLAILPPDDGASVAEAWCGVGRLSGVMFVSPAAAHAWIDARPPGLVWPPSVWVAAPGPGTARSLASLGATEVLSPAVDAEQFDSDSLWAAIGARDWHGQRILIVHGGAGRDDLARRWREAGAVVDKVQAYRRGVATWSRAQLDVFDDAMRNPARHVWLFSSGEAIDHLLERASRSAASADPAPGHADRVAWEAHRALCTHPAITARARAAGFGRVQDCRPDIETVVRML